MSTQFDVQALLGLFLDEAFEQLAVLESFVLNVPLGLPDPGSISEPFRAAHALKGSARTMGFDAVGAAAHELEDTLDALRKGLGVTESGKTDMLRQVDVIRKGLTSTTSPETQVHRLSIDLAPDCALPSVRAELVLRALESNGCILQTKPERNSLDQHQFEVELETRETLESVRGTALAQPEVVRCEPLLSVHAQPEATRPASTVRVPTTRLDQIVDISSELVIERARLGRWTHLHAGHGADDPMAAELTEITDRISQLVGDLQHVALGVRLLPIEGTFKRLARFVHDLSSELGKEVEVVLEGTETEVDRSVADILTDPLIHLIRNCIDHGIESPDGRQSAGKPRYGKLTLSARQADGEVLIEIEDDGKGIDAAKVRESAIAKGIVDKDSPLDEAACLNLIFCSGLTTAATVTDLSGRGVGMDIVRANLEKVGGHIEVSTKFGEGTKFSITLPISLSILRCLLVQAGTSIIAVPEAQVRATAIAPCEVPTRALSQALDGVLGEDNECPYAIIVESRGRETALGVDRLIAEQDLVVKPLAKWLVSAEGVLGASILANGRVVLIVDPVRLVDSLTLQPDTA